MQLRCPVCGYEYSRLWVKPGELTTCRRCGVGFVAGEASAIKKAESAVPFKESWADNENVSAKPLPPKPVKKAFSSKTLLAIAGSVITVLVLVAKGGKILYAASQLFSGGIGSGDLQVVDLQTRMLSNQVCQCSGIVKNQSSRPVHNVSVKIKVFDAGTGMPIPGGANAFIGRIEAGGVGSFSEVCAMPAAGGGAVFPDGGLGRRPGMAGSMRPMGPSGSGWPGTLGGGMSRSVRCEIESVSGSY